MKSHLIFLAKSREGRSIDYDGKETIHIFWDGVHLYLCPLEFKQVVKLLEHSVFELDLTRFQAGNCCLQQKKLGHFQFTLNDHCLPLTLADFLNLVMLVRLADRQLARTKLYRGKPIETHPFQIHLDDREEIYLCANNLSPWPGALNIAISCNVSMARST